jgi:hypothetical protein
MALRFAAGVVDLGVAVGQHEDAEGALDAILSGIAHGMALSEAVAGVSAGRPAALLRVGDAVRVLAGG